jgi:hypothetical protein
VHLDTVMVHAVCGRCWFCRGNPSQLVAQLVDINGPGAQHVGMTTLLDVRGVHASGDEL